MVKIIKKPTIFLILFILTCTCNFSEGHHFRLGLTRAYAQEKEKMATPSPPPTVEDIIELIEARRKVAPKKEWIYDYYVIDGKLSKLLQQVSDSKDYFAEALKELKDFIPQTHYTNLISIEFFIAYTLHKIFKDYEESIKIYKGLKKKYPNEKFVYMNNARQLYPEVFLQLATLYEETGQKKESKQCLEEILINHSKSYYCVPETDNYRDYADIALDMLSSLNESEKYFEKDKIEILKIWEEMRDKIIKTKFNEILQYFAPQSVLYEYGDMIHGFSQVIPFNRIELEMKYKVGYIYEFLSLLKKLLKEYANNFQIQDNKIIGSGEISGLEYKIIIQFGKIGNSWYITSIKNESF